MNSQPPFLVSTAETPTPDLINEIADVIVQTCNEINALEFSSHAIWSTVWLPTSRSMKASLGVGSMTLICMPLL